MNGKPPMTVNEAGRRGGRARAKKLTKKRRREIASIGGQAFAAKMRAIKERGKP